MILINRRTIRESVMDSDLIAAVISPNATKYPSMPGVGHERGVWPLKKKIFLRNAVTKSLDTP
jgi:hypothetical protein